MDRPRRSYTRYYSLPVGVPTQILTPNSPYDRLVHLVGFPSGVSNVTLAPTHDQTTGGFRGGAGNADNNLTYLRVPRQTALWARSNFGTDYLSIMVTELPEGA